MPVRLCKKLGPVALTVVTLASLPPATSHAALTAELRMRALPIPGVSGSGDRLGAAAVLQGEARVSGSEYGGSAPPLIGLKYYAPAGTVVHPQGFATCAQTVLEESGPQACPKGSAAGPKGSALGTVSFGGERVPESVSIQPFFAPGGGMTVFVDGTTPTVVEVLATAHEVGAAPPFGPEFVGAIPLIETVPGGLDASFVEGTVSVGAARRQGTREISYITLPTTCPKSGWATKAEGAFLGGAIVQAGYTMPCPPKRPG